MIFRPIGSAGLPRVGFRYPRYRNALALKPPSPSLRCSLFVLFMSEYRGDNTTGFQPPAIFSCEALSVIVDGLIRRLIELNTQGAQVRLHRAFNVEEHALGFVAYAAVVDEHARNTPILDARRRLTDDR